MQKVTVIDEYNSDLELPGGVIADARSGRIELWNAARPILGHETYHGAFRRGVFYSVIYPDRDYANEYRERTQQLDAYRIVFVQRHEVIDWARDYLAELEVEETVEDFGYSDLVNWYYMHHETD